MFSRAAVSIVLASLTSVASAQTSAFDTTPIEKATGMKGTYNAAENVYKVTKPRPNLAAIDGWKIPPFLGVSSYAAFTPIGDNQVMVMGDNVLNEDEVGPTIVLEGKSVTIARAILSIYGQADTARQLF